MQLTSSSNLKATRQIKSTPDHTKQSTPERAKTKPFQKYDNQTSEKMLWLLLLSNLICGCYTAFVMVAKQLARQRQGLSRYFTQHFGSCNDTSSCVQHSVLKVIKQFSLIRNSLWTIDFLVLIFLWRFTIEYTEIVFETRKKCLKF